MDIHEKGHVSILSMLSDYLALYLLYYIVYVVHILFIRVMFLLHVRGIRFYIHRLDRRTHSNNQAGKKNSCRSTVLRQF